MSGDGWSQEGEDAVRSAAKSAPDAPGVYRMLDARGAVLYVGKAKSLAKRLPAYLRRAELPERLVRMVGAARSVELAMARSEAEALLMEADLIRSLSPKFNILLREGRRPSRIALNGHEFPRLVAGTGAAEGKGSGRKGGRSYGPFHSHAAAREAADALSRALGLRTCSDSELSGRTRACLKHQIGRCRAPCVGKVSKEDYAEAVASARGVLEGRGGRAAKEMEARMAAASAALDFEAAAAWRDRLRALSALTRPKGIDFAALGDADAIAVAAAGGKACACRVGCRGGVASGHSVVLFENSAGASLGELAAAAAADAAARPDPPPLLLIAERAGEGSFLGGVLADLDGALAGRAGKGARVRTAETKAEADLLELARLGAEEGLARLGSDGESWARGWSAAAALLRLEAPPARIEIYDNSHTGGKAAIGAFVVAGPEGFRKKAYRTFDAGTESGDDVGTMRSVLERRFKGGTQTPDPPDLVLIDGGSTQLGAARAVLSEKGLAARVLAVGIAKGEKRDAGGESIHLPDGTVLRPDNSDPGMRMLQILRDEAHRFAIGTHRRKRSKEAAGSVLDSIEGLGPVLRRRLAASLGSPKEILAAGEAAVAALPGFGPGLAARVVEALGTR